jgi:hypothetical protein
MTKAMEADEPTATDRVSEDMTIPVTATLCWFASEQARIIAAAKTEQGMVLYFLPMFFPPFFYCRGDCGFAETLSNTMDEFITGRAGAQVRALTQARRRV